VCEQFAQSLHTGGLGGCQIGDGLIMTPLHYPQGRHSTVAGPAEEKEFQVCGAKVKGGGDSGYDESR